MGLLNLLAFCLAPIACDALLRANVHNPNNGRVGRRSKVTWSSKDSLSAASNSFMPVKYTQLEGSAWLLKMTIEGFDDRNRNEVGSPITVTTRMVLDPIDDSSGLSPVRLIGRKSQFLTKGYVWDIGKGLDSNSDDTSTYLQFNVKGEGLAPHVPDGSLYVNARIQRVTATQELKLTDALITFKRPQRARFLFMSFDGLLAEFKIVGVASLTPVGLS